MRTILRMFIVGWALLVIIAGSSWGLTTLDDIAKELKSLQISQVRLEERFSSETNRLEGKITSEIGALRTLTTTLFTAFFAAMAGLFYFVLDISRSLRIPKEERVARLEEMREKLKDYLGQVSDKLHLPKPIL